jgi:hypothetical protein
VQDQQRLDIDRAFDEIREVKDRVKKVEEEMPEAKLAKRLVFTTLAAIGLELIHFVSKILIK